MPFDRRLVRRFRGSAIAFSSALFAEVVSLLVSRASFFLKESALRVLVLGCRDGALIRGLLPILSSKSQIFQCDITYSVFSDREKELGVVADDEALPFKSESFDCIMSNLSLHNVNNLVGALSCAHSVLREGGFFMGATFGSSTLRDVKKAMLEAEGEKIVPRIQPFINAYEMPPLLQSCGFRDVVVDVETIWLRYRCMHHLLKDLKDMGEGNAFRKGYVHLSRDVMSNAWDLYRKRVGCTSADDAPVGYEIVVFKGNKKGK
ncbi:methyltransferase domain-containing protein [Candidatus Anaplasma sp. TIGMIC]|uniref:methyltransferase domain-containing protein n=1 Tax=Candidatus Anaplasma sp. TIGMIC TaxID=3020713 RepID=UPI00232E1A4F|nr:methyltransferase domain-containing protein [Candidatus Anaplasma sp. TIGMIC]MDB1135669.1 methyltransferase domain-containing protein [Candidatus Anaplasma sp. TIGMIC]